MPLEADSKPEAREVGGRRGPRRSAQPEAAEYAIPAVVANVQRHGTPAWPAFLAEYSDFILRCLARVTYEYDERMEIYAQVCRRLHADDCRRLRQFQGRGARGRCKFTTWLSAVVQNMAREWIRTTRGRRRLYRRVQRLPRLERAVFRHHYWDGLTSDQIVSTMNSAGADVRRDRVDAALARLRTRLDADHLWRLAAGAARTRRHQRIDDSEAGGERRTAQPVSRSPDAEELAVSRSARGVLRELVRALPDDLGTVLEMRYRRGLTAKEIARTLRIPNYKRVYELQARALVLLRDELAERGLTLGDLRDAGAHTEADRD